MDIAAPAVLRPLLLAQTEELIGRGEQNRTRLLVVLEQRAAAGLAVDGADDLLRINEERLARLHERRLRLLP
jgi:chemotaxis signal transduction protein